MYNMLHDKVFYLLQYLMTLIMSMIIWYVNITLLFLLGISAFLKQINKGLNFAVFDVSLQ